MRETQYGSLLYVSGGTWMVNRTFNLEHKKVLCGRVHRVRGLTKEDVWAALLRSGRTSSLANSMLPVRRYWSKVGHVAPATTVHNNGWRPVFAQSDRAVRRY